MPLRVRVRLPKLLFDGTLRLAKTFMRAFVRLATHMLKGICRQLCVATHDMNVLANMGGCPSPWFAFGLQERSIHLSHLVQREGYHEREQAKCLPER